MNKDTERKKMQMDTGSELKSGVFELTREVTKHSGEKQEITFAISVYSPDDKEKVKEEELIYKKQKGIVSIHTPLFYKKNNTEWEIPLIYQIAQDYSYSEMPLVMFEINKEGVKFDEFERIFGSIIAELLAIGQWNEENEKGTSVLKRAKSRLSDRGFYPPEGELGDILGAYSKLLEEEFYQEFYINMDKLAYNSFIVLTQESHSRLLKEKKEKEKYQDVLSFLQKFKKEDK